MSVLIIGFARTGQSVARVLSARGCRLAVVDDAPSSEAATEANRLGLELVSSPSREVLAALADRSELVVVSPGVPPTHAIFGLADPDCVVSEIELAYQISTLPIVAITGTNGKTTVTTLVAEMLRHSGIASLAAGNIGPPLIEAVISADLSMVVAEVSSFQLALSKSFAPRVGTWLNFAEDHLDWHPTLSDYASSKARIWQAQRPGDIAVANADDPVVMSAAAATRSRLVTFGASEGDYHLSAGRFRGPGDADLGPVELLARRLPHDLLNAVGALATACEAGATAQGCALALERFTALPHRVELVGRFDDVEFYDDSKATTPSAVIAALGAFDSVVLIAGGRNKGLDLSVIADFVRATPRLRLRAVITIGEAGEEIAEIFSPDQVVERASTMDEAVALAFGHVERGDVVLLSPGCASFDWYRSYEQRGRDFARAVHALRATRHPEAETVCPGTAQPVAGH